MATDDDTNPAPLGPPLEVLVMCCLRPTAAALVVLSVLLYSSVVWIEGVLNDLRKE